MGEKKVTKREQVKLAIEKGTMTKADIAEELNISPGSVSSQMTYLRWMGKFIKYDEDKALSFVSQEEYDEWQEELKANRKSPAASTRSPEEQATAVAKTIANQQKQLAKWETKVDEAQEILDADITEENEDNLAEAEANVTLLQIKIKRNEAKAADLPEPVEEEEEVVKEEDELL